MNTGVKILLAVIIGFVLLIGGCVAITGGLFTLGIKKAGEIEDNERQQVADAITSKSAIRLDVSKFLSEYDANKLTADGKYIDNVLTLSGVVTDISDSLGQLSISLSPDNKSFNSVSCFFDNADKGELTRLSKGQQAKITGICKSGSLLTKCKITSD